jgi:hypothetical protein
MGRHLAKAGCKNLYQRLEMSKSMQMDFLIINSLAVGGDANNSGGIAISADVQKQAMNILKKMAIQAANFKLS